MTRPALVQVHGGGREAVGAPASLPAGAFFRAGDGRVWRVEADGCLELLQQGACPHAGVAGDPCAAGRHRRYP